MHLYTRNFVDGFQRVSEISLGQFENNGMKYFSCEGQNGGFFASLMLRASSRLLRCRADAAPSYWELRRRGMPHFAVRRRNFIPLFYGVSGMFLRLP